jgi:hypothetical protein
MIAAALATPVVDDVVQGLAATRGYRVQMPSSFYASVRRNGTSKGLVVLILKPAPESNHGVVLAFPPRNPAAMGAAHFAFGDRPPEGDPTPYTAVADGLWFGPLAADEVASPMDTQWTNKFLVIAQELVQCVTNQLPAEAATCLFACAFTSYAFAPCSLVCIGAQATGDLVDCISTMISNMGRHPKQQ